MINNKIISLAIIGIVLGAIVGIVVNSEQFNLLTATVLGGIIGFLGGWIWSSRTVDTEK